MRDAVALVGETLAATHNPDALLPVILQASVEATGAAGGAITAEGVQLATRGSTPADATGKLEVPLEVSEGRPALMTLYPAAAGFGPEAEDAAAWIAAQALIALENARLHGQVQRQAVTDELTGLANRRSFLARLDAEVVRSRRSGSPLGIVLADLDDFKRVNDTYGHAAGDQALRSFADIVHSSSGTSTCRSGSAARSSLCSYRTPISTGQPSSRSAFASHSRRPRSTTRARASR